MASKLEDSIPSAVCKSVKLAGVEVRPLLAGPAPEWEDSGIDSDDTNALRALALQFSEESSDEDDKELISTHAPGELIRDYRDPPNDLDLLIKWHLANGEMIEETPLEDSLTDRSSPLLYEVELTASDEDDDASVLELVIPLQSRYQRVPTSSPKKTIPKPKCFFAKLFCCICIRK